MSFPAIKLSSRATREFWEIPVRFEDAHLLALDKPAGLPTSPDPEDPQRPSLVSLLHAGIAEGKPWAQVRGLTWLMNAHRLDAEVGGVLLLARSKPVFATLADFFGIEKPGRTVLALVHGTPAEDRFEVDAKLAPHPTRPGMMCVDSKLGKQSRTAFQVLEKFARNTLLRCELFTMRPHQVRVHLGRAGLRVVGDEMYGGKPLWLSRLKPDFRLKPGRTERPLLARPALHADQLTLPHPVTGEALTITAPWPKDLAVAVKYLRRYAV